ncbi:MAG TPA: DUF3575 domain-containing protein [Chitinophagaceae bacterium]|nr:DUF3575 domain-containing protein [Chitinophagaceae bacterium]
MKKAFFLTLIIFCFNTAKSQWGITFTPSVVSLHSGYIGVQFGANYTFNSRWDMVTELTTTVGEKNDPSVSNQQYFRVKPELRYYLSKRQANAGAYTGIQLSYASRSWKVGEGSYFEDRLFEDSAITFTSASVRSPVYTSSAQIGSLIAIGKHWCIDFFFGAGVRIIDTKYSDVQNKGKTYAARPNCKIMFSPDPAWRVNGTITRPHFNLGMRFIYRL